MNYLDKPDAERRTEKLYTDTFKVVILREQTKVKEWKISDEEALAVHTLRNYAAGVCDGKRATKFIMFDELAKGIEEGKSYRIKKIGWSNYGEIRTMLTRHQTVAYAAVQVPAHLEAQARDLICPESMLVPLREMAEVEEMTPLTVQGWVKEVRSTRKQRPVARQCLEGPW
ncbi:unnamed protein product [Boreogadus saida]